MKQVELMTGRLLADAGEHLSITEETVRLCMETYYPASFKPQSDGSKESDAAYVALLRTGAIFCVGCDVWPTFDAVLNGEVDLTGIELPPLPFPRIVIEARDFEADAPGGLVSIYGDESRMDILALAILERERGTEWDVFVAHGWADADGDEPSEFGVPFAYRIRATDNGVEFVDGYYPVLIDDDGEVDQDMQTQRFIGVAINAAHLITASSVKHVEQALPRPQRREMQRRYLALPPRVYFVDMSAAGDVEPGHGDRQYHVRWLVRGHWRHNKGGDTFVRAKGGLCSWVSPHVKGPAGAPWKGRPVHVR